MVGTFYVIPGSERFQEDRQAWELAAQSPYVKLANHTWTHRGAMGEVELDEELRKANEVLHPLLPDLSEPCVLDFGRPSGAPWTVSDDEVARALENTTS
jgi:hypothetical protein